MNEIKILVIEPKKEPVVKIIADEEKDILKIIGQEIGYIELEENVDLIYNDNAKIDNLDFNRVIKDDIICGTFVIAGNKNDDWCSLEDSKIQKYKKIFALKNDIGIIEFFRDVVKESSKLLDLNLKNVERWRKNIK